MFKLEPVTVFKLESVTAEEHAEAVGHLKTTARVAGSIILCLLLCGLLYLVGGWLLSVVDFKWLLITAVALLYVGMFWYFLGPDILKALAPVKE